MQCSRVELQMAGFALETDIRLCRSMARKLNLILKRHVLVGLRHRGRNILGQDIILNTHRQNDNNNKYNTHTILR